MTIIDTQLFRDTFDESTFELEPIKPGHCSDSSEKNEENGHDTMADNCVTYLSKTKSIVIFKGR